MVGPEPSTLLNGTPGLGVSFSPGLGHHMEELLWLDLTQVS